MNGTEIDGIEFRREVKIHMANYNRYTHELVTLNKEENALIETMPGETKYEQFIYYEKNHTDKLQEYEKKRKDLENKFGKYSSIYTCPYYTIVDNVFKLNLLVSRKDPNYKVYKKNLYKWKDKHVQSEYTKHHGICKGLAFCLDDVYICFHDEIEDRDIFEFKVEYYKKEDWLPYKIVTNGKDYL